jgi:hypothetical protein
MLDDRPFVFTRHARNRMRRVRLSEADVIAIARSASASRRAGGRVNLWKEWAGPSLRIVVVDEPDAIVVVTVIWPAKSPEGLGT